MLCFCRVLVRLLPEVLQGSGAGLGVTIQSTYQDNVFLDAIRPHGVTELERHIEEKKAVLTELGISFYSYGRHYGGH